MYSTITFFSARVLFVPYASLCDKISFVFFVKYSRERKKFTKPVPATSIFSTSEICFSRSFSMSSPANACGLFPIFFAYTIAAFVAKSPSDARAGCSISTSLLSIPNVESTSCTADSMSVRTIHAISRYSRNPSRRDGFLLIREQLQR